MAITVAEALKIGGLKKCHLLAGQNKVNNIIDFVDTMEVPDITPWLKKNELLVTTAYSIKDDRSALVKLVENLKLVNAAGLAIKAKFIGEIPSEIIELAEKLELPLIEIPADIPFIEIIHPLMKAIINRQARYLEFSEAAHRALTKIELEGNGLQDIAQTLHTLIGNVVIITDDHLRVYATAGNQPLDCMPLITTEEKDGICQHLLLTGDDYEKIYNLAGNTWLKFPNCSWGICVRPSRVKEKVYGYTFIIEKEKPVKELELIALEHAATTISLDFVKRDALNEHAKRLEQDFFSDLLTGNIRSGEEAAHRAEMLSWPRGPWMVIYFDIDNFESLLKQHDEMYIQALKQQIYDQICYILRKKQHKYTVLTSSDSFTCLISVRTNPNLLLAENFISEVQKALFSKDKITVSAGISAVFQEISDLAVCYHDARTALKISRLTKGRGTFGHIDQYALERVLMTMASNELIVDYYYKILGTLEEYDVKNNSNMVQTANVLVQNMGLRSATAKNLYVHRNTLAYRLNKIETLTGLNLARNENLIGLALALKLRPFVLCDKAQLLDNNRTLRGNKNITDKYVRL